MMGSIRHNGIIHSKGRYLVCAVLAYVTTLGLSVNLDMQEAGDGDTFASLLFSSMGDGLPVTKLVMFLGILALYIYI